MQVPCDRGGWVQVQMGYECTLTSGCTDLWLSTSLLVRIVVIYLVVVRGTTAACLLCH